MEKVRIEMQVKATIDSLRDFVLDWAKRYPEGKLIGSSIWGENLTMTLEMPPATTVVVPQLIDARGEEVS